MKNTDVQNSGVARIWLANFLQKYRSILLIAIIIALLVLAGLAGWAIYSQSVTTKYANKVEQIETTFNSWKTESNSDKKLSLEKKMQSEIGQVEKTAPTSYGLLKSYFIEAQYLELNNDNVKAEQKFYKVFELDSTNYLAPIALLNAMVCAENASNSELAESLGKDFQKSYPHNKLLAAQVGFSLGRIYEGQNDQKQALKAYENLIQNFPESDWTKLARDRIFILKSPNLKS